MFCKNGPWSPIHKRSEKEFQRFFVTFNPTYIPCLMDKKYLQNDIILLDNNWVHVKHTYLVISFYKICKMQNSKMLPKIVCESDSNKIFNFIHFNFHIKIYLFINYLIKQFLKSTLIKMTMDFLIILRFYQFLEMCCY